MLLTAVAAIAVGHAQIDPNVVKWRDYKEGSYSKATALGQFVISTPAEFQSYVNRMGPEGVGDARDVQWGKEALIAIHLGTRNSAGYSVEVEKIQRTKPNETCVFWDEVTPRRERSRAQVTTSPWTIVRFDRPGTRITFSGGQKEAGPPGGIRIISYPGYRPLCSCCEDCIRANQDRLPWRIYATGLDGPTMMGSTFVMDTPADFASYVRNYRMTGLGDGSDIDWAHERLLAIHLGRKIGDGYRIGVDHIDVRDSGEIRVCYAEIQPSGRGIAAGSTSGPYTILRIPRVGSQVVFSKRMALDTDRFSPDCCTCPNCNCGH
ncbi:MAG TPA: protease complex subunit PrcB family protein [Fimbriimonadaceae bacterium]|nr:protease complex subunit PrcB family protein [Fimbriimonadaceae bacterium]